MSGSDGDYCENVISCSVDTTVVKEYATPKRSLLFWNQSF
jgi:hypothetical protein